MDDRFERMSDDEIRAELDKSPFMPKHPPTDEQMDRARQIARERGWLTDEGFIWERCDG